VVIGQADQSQDHEDARRSCYDVTQELVPHALYNAWLRSEVAATPPSVARTRPGPSPVARGLGYLVFTTEDFTMDAAAARVPTRFRLARF